MFSIEKLLINVHGVCTCTTHWNELITLCQLSFAHTHTHTSILHSTNRLRRHSSFLFLFTTKEPKIGIDWKISFLCACKEEIEIQSNEVANIFTRFQSIKMNEIEIEASGELIQKNQNARAAVETSEMGIWMWWIMFDVLLSYWA